MQAAHAESVKDWAQFTLAEEKQGLVQLGKEWWKLWWRTRSGPIRACLAITVRPSQTHETSCSADDYYAHDYGISPRSIATFVRLLYTRSSFVDQHSILFLISPLAMISHSMVWRHRSQRRPETWLHPLTSTTRLMMLLTLSMILPSPTETWSQ